MMNRRLVNLVMTDYKNRMFSLHRMDLSKLLFYPSTAEAEAAGGRVDKKGKPPKTRKLRLPPPIMGFQPFPTSSASDRRDPWSLRPGCSMFVLLHGPRGLGSEPSRILFTNTEGHATMYDVDARSVMSVPDPNVVTGFGGIHIVTGTGAGEESLYVMRPDGPFEVLEFGGRDDKKVLEFGSGEKRRTIFTRNRSSSLLWKSLPPLPVPAKDEIYSFAVVDSDRIICVSAGPLGGQFHGDTFCFDTVSQEWWPAGDWVLPFYGRAVHVPELGTWLGFSSDDPQHLCAADLSGVAMAPRLGPTLQNVWEDFNPPPMEESSLVLNKDYPGIVLRTMVHWEVMQRFLVNLGSGRFFIAKVIHGEKVVSLGLSDSHDEQIGRLTVLTGVEVIRGGGDGELRMVKHKSRELVHPGLEVACVL